MTNHGPGEFASAAAQLDRPSYENLRRALQIGRWPDGRALDGRQRAICLEAVATWEVANLPPEQRSGFIEPGACASGASGDGASVAADDAPRPIRILGDD